MNRKFSSSLLFTTILAVSALLVARSALRSTPLPSASLPRVSPFPSSFASSLANFPLAFEPNRGQSHLPAAYVARGTNFNLYLSASEALLDLPHITRDPQNPEKRILTRADLHIRLASANPAARLSAGEPLLGKVNYYDRSDASGHAITQLPTYAKVQYNDVYPGIDLAYHGTRRQLEYDFVIAPGADPNLIRINFHGDAPTSLHLDAQGNLLVETPGGRLTEHQPLIYQQLGATRREISGRFRLLAQNEIGFTLSPYDHSKPLIIDPTLVYEDNFAAPPFLGNEAQYSAAYSVAAGSNGIAYATGTIDSGVMDLGDPGVCSLLSNSVDLCGGIYAIALNAAGTAIIYETTVGGGTGFGIAVDSAGNAYVAGGGSVAGTSTAFQQNPGDATCEDRSSTVAASTTCSSAIVAILNPSGAITYATNLGGTESNDEANAIALDSSGKIYVTGQAFSTNFPTTAGAIQTSFNSNSGESSATFVAKIDPTLSGTASLVYSTLLGGGGQGMGGYPSANSGAISGDQGTGIAVDSAGEAYITGDTFSSTLATSDSFETSQPLPVSPYVAKINASGTSFLWATYLGGSLGNICGSDKATGIAIDSSGNAYVTGFAATSNFPTTPGSFQPQAKAFGEAFVSKINPTGTALVYSTFVGGTTQINRNKNDLGCPSQGSAGIALDANNDAYIAGLTYTGDFPIGALTLMPLPSSNFDFIAELNPSGSSLLFSTYMPGADVTGIALDGTGGIYVSGSGSQIIYNVTTIGTVSDLGNSFVDKVDLSVPGPAVNLSPQAVTFSAASATSQPVLLKNLGNGTLNVSGLSVTGGAAETDNCTPTVAVGSTCTINVTDTGSAGTVQIADNAPDTPQLITVDEGGSTPIAELSRTTLVYPPENVGSTSPAQVVVLASIGNAPLVLTNATITGDFKETNNCPSTLPVDSTCQLSFTFTPTASGIRTGTFEIQDNASAPSKITLTSGVPNLDIQINNSDNIATITPGQTATYKLQVLDGSGYSGPATVTCSGAPKGATCTTQSPISLNGSIAVNETVTVTTTQGSGAVPNVIGSRPNLFGLARVRRLAPALLLGLALSLSLLLTAQTKRHRTVLLPCTALLLGAFLTSCGSTTIINQAPPSSSGTPPGTYQLIVTVSANGSSTDAALTLQVN